MVIRGTVEQRILELQERKMALANGAMGEEEASPGLAGSASRTLSGCLARAQTTWSEIPAARREKHDKRKTHCKREGSETK